MTKKEETKNNQLLKNLKKFEKSDKWVSVQDYCRKKHLEIKERIKKGLVNKDEEYRYKLKYSDDDILLYSIYIVDEIAGLLSDEVGEKEFKEFLLDFLINKKEYNFTAGYINQYGFSPSKINFSEKDLDVSRLTEYSLIFNEVNRLSAYIGSLEKSKEVKIESIY